MPRIKPRLTDNYTDNVITEIEDGQHPYPSVAAMRDSQRRGSEGCGLAENETGKLNGYQGHNVKAEEDE